MRFVVFICALAVRIAAIEFTGAQMMTFGDGPDYLATASSLCTERVYPERGNLPFFRAPGLPFFIAGVTACHPQEIRLVKYGLAACDALSVLLVFLIAFRLHGTALPAWIAALLAALHPFFVGSVTDIRGEPLFMMLLLASIWLLLRGKAASSGALIGLAALVRPTGLLCIPLFALHAWWAGRFRHGLILGVAAMLALAPWVARNVLRFGEPILVNDASGYNLWRGSHPELMQVVETTEPQTFARLSHAFESQTAVAAAQVVDGLASTPAGRDRAWRALALTNIHADPDFAVRAALKKAAIYWRPWLHPAEHGRAAITLSVFVIAGLYVFGGTGLLRHPDRVLAIAVALYFVALWLAHVPYFPSIRLRAPLTDPLLIAFAAGPIAAMVQRIRGKSRRPGLPPLSEPIP